MTAIKIQTGDDLRLTSLMARHSLNFVTGADRAALLAYGRDVFAAARGSKCLAQIEEPAQPVCWIRFCSDGSTEGPIMHSQICEARKTSGAWTPLYAGAAPAAVAPQGEYPHEQMDAMALDRYKVVPSNASMLWRHAVVAGDGTQQLYVGREVECQNMVRKFAGAFLDGAFAFHSTAAAPTAQAAPALEAPAAPPVPVDEFRGDTPSLVRNIVALLELDADGALVPHGVGGHARGLLSAAAARLAAAPQAPNCTRCSGSGEDPEGYLTHGRGPDDHTVDGPCRSCDGTGATPQAPAAPVGDEREAFEAWIKKDGGDLSTFGSGQNRHYNNSAVNNAWTGWSSRAAQAAPAAPVAYLDLGAGGYMDLGTDLSEQQLGALPKGRHMLAIIGTYGIDGYAAAPAAPSADGLREQHDRDSAELRRLCQARDEARRERDLARALAAGLQASTGHLSALVDGQNALLEKAKATMTALHGSASPIDESGGDFDARIPAAAFARFVDEHAALLHAMAQSPVAAPAAPAVDASSTDDEIEAEFIQAGGKWTGDYWRIEDADLHPYARRVEHRAAIAAQAAAKGEHDAAD